MKHSESRRVVISGMGIVSPIGISLGEVSEALLNARSGVARISQFDVSNQAVQIAAEATQFDPKTFLDPKEIRRNDRFIQMALAAADMAVADSGIARDELKEAGVAIGVGMGGLYTIEQAKVDLESSGPKKVSPFLIPSILANLASGQISIRFGTKGANYAIASACASGSQAIGQAYREIQAGRRKLWLAGGAEAPITPLSLAGFSSARALSRRNEEPEAASRPFDEARDGFVLGEGAAILILESLDSALERGAKIYAEIVGFGIGSDGYHVTEPEPNGEGASLAMREALADAGRDAVSVDYVNAHATSTPLGDKVEAIALSQVFGKNLESVFVSSTKSLTGHACGAAGAIETVFCSLMLDRGFLAPAKNLDVVPEDIRFKIPRAQDVSFTPSLVMNNSFGFGGVNTSLLLQRWAP